MYPRRDITPHTHTTAREYCTHAEHKIESCEGSYDINEVIWTSSHLHSSEGAIGYAVPDQWLARDADVRTDLPRYRIYRDGVLVDEVTDITAYWNDNMVAFLLGCSFSFESALEAAGLRVRHNEEGKNVPMYKTNIPCRPAGVFRGNMVVSMRPYPGNQVAKAAEITARYPKVHGGPVHIGEPSVIGIADLSLPDYGDAVTLREGELPVFWACGVTPQNVILESRPDIAITHAPGCMLVVDIANESLSLS